MERYSDVGRALEGAREREGVSQEEFATRAKISGGRYRQVIRSTAPRGTLVRLALAGDLPVDDVLVLAGEPPLRTEERLGMSVAVHAGVGPDPEDATYVSSTPGRAPEDVARDLPLDALIAELARRARGDNPEAQ